MRKWVAFAAVCAAGLLSAAGSAARLLGRSVPPAAARRWGRPSLPPSGSHPPSIDLTALLSTDRPPAPDPEVVGGVPRWNFSSVCGSRKPTMLLLRHKGKRRVDKIGERVRHTVYGDSYRFRDVREAEAAAHIRKFAAGWKGARVVAVDGSAVAAAAAPIPLSDSHGGRHSLFEPWPLQAQLHRKRALETVLWDVVWHRRPEDATGPPQLLPPQPAVWAAAIPNAWVAGGSVYTCGFGLGAGGCLWELGVPVVARRTVDAAFVLCDGNCNGYFHFTHEHLPRLAAALDGLRLHTDVSLVVTAASVPFVREYLTDVLGFDASRIVPQRNPKGTQRVGPLGDAVYAKLAIVPHWQACGNSHAHSLAALRRAVFSRLSLSHSAPVPRSGFTALLAERGGAEGRMPVNWPDVLRAVHAVGGVAVRRSFGNTSVRAQIAAFNAADIVVGPHGSNLANLLWMRSGTTVLEFMAYSYGNLCYYTSGARLGLRHRFVLHSSKKGAPYSVSPAEVVRHVADAAGIARGEAAMEWER